MQDVKRLSQGDVISLKTHEQSSVAMMTHRVLGVGVGGI